MFIFSKASRYKKFLSFLLFLFFIFSIFLTSAKQVLANYQSTILGDSPVDYWRLNEASGTTANDIAGSNNGTYSSSDISYSQPGLLAEPSSSVLFTNYLGEITLPSGIEINPPLSIEMWVKPISISQIGFLFATGAYGMGLNNGNGNIYVYGNTNSSGGSYNTTNSLTAGDTYYVVMTVDNSGNFSVYVGTGGSVTQWGTGNPGGTGLNYSGQENCIGSSCSSENFPGYIEDVALYNKILTPTQMTNHYEAGLTTPTPTPTATPTPTPTATPTPPPIATPTPTIVTPTPSPSIIINASSTTSSNTSSNNPPNPNMHEDWRYVVDAGPDYVGTPTFISNTSEGQGAMVLIGDDATTMDLSVSIQKLSGDELMNQLPINPFPWMEGFNTASDIYQINSVSAFNGYPVTQFDKQVTIVMPYDPNKLYGVTPQKLRIAWYDMQTEKWEVLNNPTIVNTENHTIADTTKNLTYFAVVYPTRS